MVGITKLFVRVRFRGVRRKILLNFRLALAPSRCASLPESTPLTEFRNSQLYGLQRVDKKIKKRYSIFY